jgi:isocitrate/isopropylmalate dehydrogenase
VDSRKTLVPAPETPLKDKGPEHVDFVLMRENTGGIYTGIGGVTQKGTPVVVTATNRSTPGSRARVR